MRDPIAVNLVPVNSNPALNLTVEEHNLTCVESLARTMTTYYHAI